jgi:hypothetical protein
MGCHLLAHLGHLLAHHVIVVLDTYIQPLSHHQTLFHSFYQFASSQEAMGNLFIVGK